MIMKKILFTLAVMLTSVLSASAMSYEQAREQALFLTDKMAYELDLNEAQYEAAYEVNLDYLMSVATANDVYSDYWTRRNLDLSYILFDWQYRTFCGLDYFYRPLYWGDGYWHFRIFAHYPHRDFFYYGRPGIYHTYHGGHAWHVNGGHSYYHGRHFGSTTNHIGMRGGWDRGGYRNMHSGWRSNDGKHRGFDRNSAVNHGNHNGGSGSHNRGGNEGYNRGDNHNRGNGGFNRGSESRSNRSSFGGERRGGMSHEGARPSSTRETVSGSSQRSSGSYTPSRNFGSSRSAGTPSRSSSVSTPSRSFSSGAGSSSSRSAGSSHSFSGGGSSSRSFGGGGSHSGGHSGGGHSGGGHSGGGGGHFGGGHR